MVEIYLDPHMSSCHNDQLINCTSSPLHHHETPHVRQVTAIPQHTVKLKFLPIFVME
jgi:hypothetical protein